MALNVHLQQLAYFREISRADSWSAAAKKLHVSQPALSQSMRELERRLGVPLFEKVGRRQALTPTGHEVARFAQAILAQSEAFEGRLEAMQAGIAGRLRVGMVDAACLYLLPEALRAYRRENPDVDLNLAVDTSGALLQKLRGFDLDVAIVVGPVDASDVRTQIVAEESLHVYRPTGQRDSPGRAAWLLYPAASHTRRLINAALGKIDIVPRITIESHNPQVLRQMVAMGFGWSVLPTRVAGDDANLERYTQEPLVKRPLVAATRADAPEDPRVQRLLELAVEHREIS